MTGAVADRPAPGCPHVAADLVTAYARGALGAAAAWSVEAHLPGCGTCRSVLAGSGLGEAALRRNRAVLLTRLALPQPGLLERVAVRCGLRPHVWRMLSVTPSLRRSWLAGVVFVLGIAIGAAHLSEPGPARGGVLHGLNLVHAPAPLLPFLVLVPLLPLAGVAAAFSARLDPSADLATSAPISGVWLFCVRAVAVLAAALVPTVAAALALPGGDLLPLLVVLPALAVSIAALALATVTGPVAAALGAGAGWVGVSGGLALTAGSPAAAYAGPAQAGWLAVIITAGGVLLARRQVLEFGWNR